MRTQLLLISLAVIVLGAVPLFGADDHEVIFTEGYPVKKDSSGFEEDLLIGDAVITGETVVTGDDEMVELEAGGYKVTVGSNTVFRVMEVERGGETRTVLTNVLGKMRFARDRATGRDPLFASNSAVCGVRGTDFTLWAADDGATLIIVESGAVEVSSSGTSVELAKGEGVEVETGSAPGDKFQALAREIDHDEWNANRRARMLEDPVGAVRDIEKQLDAYLEQIEIIAPLAAAQIDEVIRLRKQRDEILAKDGKDKAETFYNNSVAPAQIEVRDLIVNLRFYALSSLSLRRYVGGRLYLQVKSRYITDPSAQTYRQFKAEYRQFLSRYQDTVVEHLVPADI